MSDGEHVKAHTYPRPLEWNDKRDRRCGNCKRLGPKENYKAGPLLMVGNKTERVWLCKDGCKPAKTDHYTDAARGPKRYDEADPPRKPYREPARKKKVRTGKAGALKKDLARIAKSTALTSMEAHRRGQGDPAQHPLLKKGGLRRKK